MIRFAGQHKPLLLIILIYLFVAGLFAVFTPDWQAPDEPAHYNYIAQVTQGKLPVIEDGDWDQGYLSTLTANKFAPELLDDLGTVQYEDHQPPLYYLLAAPLYKLSGGNLTVLRLFSVLIGVVIIYCADAIGRLMFPQRPWIGLAAAAFVAFQPQHVHILASVNNDALGWALVAVILWATIAYVKGERIAVWQLGLLVGIGFMTKTTTYFMAGVVLLAIVMRGWMDYRDTISKQTDLTIPEEAKSNTPNWALKMMRRNLAIFIIPALILGGIWWGRNIAVYDFPDFMGLGAHDAVVVGQPRTSDRIDELGFDGYLQEISRVTFNSFWGQFGWMAVPLQDHYDGLFYHFTKVMLSVAASGLLLEMVILRRRDKAPITAQQYSAWIIMIATTLLSVLAYIYYNTEFQQYQGRYMFTMLIPLGLWLALGFDAWRRLFTRGFVRDYIPGDAVIRGKEAFLPYAVVVAFLPLAVLDLWLLWQVIVPNL